MRYPIKQPTISRCHCCADRCQGQTGRCRYGFPKTLREATVEEADGGYPGYRRRPITRPDGTNYYEVTEARDRVRRVTNADVVPYNRVLGMRSDSHLNVEVCSSIHSVSAH